ncbi:MAG: nucleotide exchange factor GrpE [Alphaproteobacteria bacterium]|nr:nucleotide exchange factor GrpE [Alphaproteobacteria bacterium]MBV8548800.1 nucleotide exchange factor GrpE [Alphaproteobacteria bacterium]
MTEPQHEYQEDETPTRPGETADATPATEGGEADGQLAALKDQLLRALADSENLRRRTRKEVEDAGKYAVGNFAKEMLTVADNFQRALESIPADVADANLRNLLTGIEATQRQMLAAFERFGIKKLSPLGQTFDPNLHRVMMEVNDPSQPPGTVTQVLQDGYVIHDRLLREALVAVAKGGAMLQKVDTQA